MYGVETKEVNQAVKNNLNKFPLGYVLEMTFDEAKFLRSKFLTLKEGQGQHIKYVPKAFTEKGLYMLATILKSKRATETTIAIVEAYSNLRELARNYFSLTFFLNKKSNKKVKSAELPPHLLVRIACR